jgi:hypothetical protein
MEDKDEKNEEMDPVEVAEEFTTWLDAFDEHYAQYFDEGSPVPKELRIRVIEALTRLRDWADAQEASSGEGPPPYDAATRTGMYDHD